MIFEIILLRLIAALLVVLLMFWLGAIFWRAFNKNKKFDTFTRTINEQPAEEEAPVTPAPTDTDAPVGVSRKKYSRSRRDDDQPE